ncbi:MAG: hypothetical protein NC816_04380 [Candidatus Omnitrophica bacterium]|nr:hypothetical protein [Candidatus Omnitrophota bacterium]MCM8833141.1 hypothetical protein [Candidatus Omnitrophota bacterium]
MIANKNLIEEFEKKFLREEKVNYKKNFWIINELYQEAVALDIFPLKNPLEDLEIDFKIAKVVNSVSESS